MTTSDSSFETEYRDSLEYLIDYAREDWVGFSVITGDVADLAGSGTSLEERLPFFRKLVSDLLDAGAKIGDFADTEGAPFVAWPGTKEENLDRMEEEIRKLGGAMPQSNDVGWITFLDH
jgi:hypothetical protein